LKVSASNSDAVNVALREGSTPGRYTGTVPTEWLASFLAGDGKLQVQGGVTITAEYVISLDAQGHPNQRLTATSTVRSGHTAALDAPSTLLPDAGLTLTVTDADMNVNATAQDTVPVHVVNT